MSFKNRLEQRKISRTQAYPDPSVMSEDEILLAINERWRNRALWERLWDWIDESDDGRDYKRTFGCERPERKLNRAPFPWKDIFNLRRDTAPKLIVLCLLLSVLMPDVIHPAKGSLLWYAGHWIQVLWREIPPVP